MYKATIQRGIYLEPNIHPKLIVKLIFIYKNVIRYVYTKMCSRWNRSLHKCYLKGARASVAGRWSPIREGTPAEPGDP